MTPTTDPAIREAEARWPTTTDRVLHAHGQSCPHDDVLIEGTVAALARLAAAILAAIQSGGARADLFTNDGEGYTVRVVVLATDEEAQSAATPYTHDAFTYHGSDDPWRRAAERTGP